MAEERRREGRRRKRRARSERMQQTEWLSTFLPLDMTVCFLARSVCLARQEGMREGRRQTPPDHVTCSPFAFQGCKGPCRTFGFSVLKRCKKRVPPQQRYRAAQKGGPVLRINSQAGPGRNITQLRAHLKANLCRWRACISYCVWRKLSYLSFW